jgi:plastocyanin
MRRHLVVLALAAAPFAFAAPAQAASIAFGGSSGLAYSPPDVRIPVSGTVTWTGDFGTHPLRSAASGEPYTHNGTLGVGGTFDHTFGVSGVYRYYCAMHGMSSADNQVSGMSGQVVVTDNTPPVAEFTQSATQVASGTQVSFDGSSSHDAEGPVSYEWDLDADGAFDDGTGATAKFVYTSDPGVTQVVGVRLRVTDGNTDNVGPERSVVRHELTVVGQSATPPPPGPDPGTGTGTGGGAPGAGAPGPGTGTPAGDSTPPRFKLLARTLAVRSHRIKVRLSSDERGRATVALRAGSVTLAKGGGPVGLTVRAISLKLTPAGRKRLGPGKRVKATITVVVRDAAGNSRTLRRPVTIRG